MDLSVQYGEKSINFEVKYRNRTTLALQVRAPGIVTVLAPSGLAPEEIKRKVLTRSDWIYKKLLHFQNIENEKDSRDLIERKYLKYIGNLYPVKFNHEEKLKWLKVRLENNVFIIDTPVLETGLLKNLMEKWYRRQAQSLILERVEKYKVYVKANPRTVKVKEQKRRWGTCTSKGNLYFNWRIVMAPPDVIDYIVVHELSHLVFQDHSPRFWHQVEKILPDFKKSKKWLRQNGILLDF